MQAIGETLLHHLIVVAECGEDVRLGQYQKCVNVIWLCPSGNMHKVSRQFEIGLIGSQVVICLKALVA